MSVQTWPPSTKVLLCPHCYCWLHADSFSDLRPVETILDEATNAWRSHMRDDHRLRWLLWWRWRA